MLIYLPPVQKNYTLVIEISELLLMPILRRSPESQYYFLYQSVVRDLYKDRIASFCLQDSSSWDPNINFAGALRAPECFFSLSEFNINLS